VFAERSNVRNLIIAAYNQNPASALAAGRSLCVDRSEFTAKIHNNIVQQIAYMGMPFSNGDAGEGVRLLLGSDITMTPAVLVNDASNPKNQVRAGTARMTTWWCVDVRNYAYSPITNLLEIETKQTTFTSSSIKTQWLLPASLQAFDARCAHHDVGEADAAGCPAVGAFRSCAYGCNLDSTREVRLPQDKYVLGYWGGNWTVAGGALWEELRGLLTGWMDNNVRVFVCGHGLE
jgi:hypothetical protein